MFPVFVRNVVRNSNAVYAIYAMYKYNYYGSMSLESSLTKIILSESPAWIGLRVQQDISHPSNCARSASFRPCTP